MALFVEEQNSVFAKAIGMGSQPGEMGAAAEAESRPAFVWFEGKDAKGAEHRLSFGDAHRNAWAIAASVRSAAMLLGQAPAYSGGSFTVGLVTSRSCALPLAQLACFKAGATFVQCDPQWPADRTAGILQEAQVCAIVVSDDPSAACPPMGAEWAGVVVVVNGEGGIVRVEGRGLAPAALAAQTEEVARAPPQWSPPQVMYVMYTSGSTGKPKGCVVPTAGVWHRFGWGNRVLGFGPADVFVHKTPATFDCSVAELWVPLLLGCTSALVPDGAHLDFGAMATVLARGQVTVAHFVPSVLAMFLDFVAPGDLPALRQISCTGEALLYAHREKLTKAMGKKLPLFNLYGPTEASIEVTYFNATHGAMEEGESGFPIGYPGDAGVHMYVVDPADPAVRLPDGQVGEICVGGVQVAHGYLARPDLSAKSFLPNPHHPGLLYRTGDLGNFDAPAAALAYEGQTTATAAVAGAAAQLERGPRLQYKGRVDRQVKVGGVRLELGEVEAVALQQLPQLLNVAVELDAQGSLVGVFCCRPGEKVAVAEVKAALAAHLPAAYLPGEWLLRDALPLGSAGKVDHKQVAKLIADHQTANMWGSIYDEMYFADGLQVGDGVIDPTMDWAAYTDSFTGKMHERETIAEWVEETVLEILEAKPARVIEMGCGKGMILFQVARAPHVVEFAGADLASQALLHVERTWQSHFDAADLGPAGHGKLSTHVRDASNFAGFAPGAYDAVVCNGVTMYFPSASYLVEVLTNGLARVQPAGGIMHLGDVIWQQSHPLFVVRSARRMGGASFADLQAPGAAARLLAAAKDRVFDHALFYELHGRGLLPGVVAVEVQLKRGAIMSEFTRYRYNVLFHCGDAAATGPPLPLVDALAQENAAPFHDLDAAVRAVAAAFASARNGAVVCARDLLNARLSADEELASGVADTDAPAVQVGVGWGGGIDPAALRHALAAALPGAFVLLTWPRSGQRANMDVYVMPHALKLRGLQTCMADAHATSAKAAAAKPFNVESYTNVIETAKPGGDDHDDTVNAGELKKQWAAGGPAARRAVLFGLVGSKLGLHALDPNDDFTSCGGNSFLAMRIVGQLRQLFGFAVPVFTLMTESFGAFADAALAAADPPPRSRRRWWCAGTRAGRRLRPSSARPRRATCFSPWPAAPRASSRPRTWRSARRSRTPCFTSCSPRAAKRARASLTPPRSTRTAPPWWPRSSCTKPRSATGLRCLWATRGAPSRRSWSRTRCSPPRGFAPTFSWPAATSRPSAPRSKTAWAATTRGPCTPSPTASSGTSSPRRARRRAPPRPTW